MEGRAQHVFCITLPVRGVATSPGYQPTYISHKTLLSTQERRLIQFE
jgi:hypothetical protein